MCVLAGEVTHCNFGNYNRLTAVMALALAVLWPNAVDVETRELRRPGARSQVIYLFCAFGLQMALDGQHTQQPRTPQPHCRSSSPGRGPAATCARGLGSSGLDRYRLPVGLLEDLEHGHDHPVFFDAHLGFRRDDVLE